MLHTAFRHSLQYFRSLPTKKGKKNHTETFYAAHILQAVVEKELIFAFHWCARSFWHTSNLTQQSSLSSYPSPKQHVLTACGPTWTTAGTAQVQPTECTNWTGRGTDAAAALGVEMNQPRKGWEGTRSKQQQRHLHRTWKSEHPATQEVSKWFNALFLKKVWAPLVLRWALLSMIFSHIPYLYFTYVFHPMPIYFTGKNW